MAITAALVLIIVQQPEVASKIVLNAAKPTCKLLLLCNGIPVLHGVHDIFGLS